MDETEGKTQIGQALTQQEAVSTLSSALLPDKDEGVPVVQRISGKQAWINGVSYRVSDAAAGILNDQNKEILKQAGIRFNSKNGTVTSITGLEIRTNGEEARADGISRNLVLKGNQNSIQGDLTIHSCLKAERSSANGEYTGSKPFSNRYPKGALQYITNHTL